MGSILGDDLRGVLRRLSLWAGSALLVSLVWLDVKQVWVAVVWVVFAIALSLIGRRFKIADLNYQEHWLAVAATTQLIAVNHRRSARNRAVYSASGMRVRILRHFALLHVERSCLSPACGLGAYVGRDRAAGGTRMA